MFFKDTDELKKYVDLNESLEFAAIEPKLNEVNRDVLKHHFGLEFIEELQDAYNATTNGDISTLPLAQQKAIEKIRFISAPAAVALYITSGQVQIDNAGIFIASNANRKTAFEWQIKDLIKSYLRPCYQAIEDAILFFKSNISDYSTYEDSDEYVYSTICFIPSAKEFTKFYTPLNNSYMSYLKMRSCMDKAEEDILKVVLPNYYADLKTKIQSGSLGVADKAIMPYIKKAVANLTVLRALSELNATFDEYGFMVFDNTSGVKSGASKKTGLGEVIVRAQESLSASAKTYLEELKKYLDDNLVTYTMYAADPKYVAAQTSSVSNSSDQNYFLGV